MKAHLSSIVILSVVLAQSAMAQTKPGNPEDNGLTPKTETFYVNVPPDSLNNGKVESLGVAIGNNGHVIIGWEDDGSGVEDFEAVWMLFDSVGKPVLADGIFKAADGSTLTTKYRAYFRKDGSLVPGQTSWGPKIKSNLFGDGIGMGATSFDLGLEVPEFAAIQKNANGEAGDFPSVQLLTNEGSPIAIVSGMSDTDADPDGDVRIGDWEYLSNGNVVIVGESRQRDDLVSRWKGAAPGNHAIYRIVDQTGKEIRPLGLVSQVPDPNDMWHGAGATKNGFGVRFSLGGQTTVRLFDNTGAPTSTNINIASLTGKPITAGGGRGDGTGFHGNGNDAYALVNSGTDDQGAKQVWLTVLNANGTLRYSRAVADDVTLTSPDRVDVAIDSSGRAIVVFDDTSFTAGANRLVLGRMFDEKGNPVGKTFYVSEKETDATAALESRRPRAAWRGGLAAVVWESKNHPDSPDKSVVAARLFSTFQPGGLKGLLGYWRMDETDGTVVTDSSGKSNHGKIINTSAGSWVTDAERGKVYKATGTNVIDFGTILPAMSPSNSFTWSLWIKSAETGTASAADNNIVFGNRYNPAGAEFSPREFIKFTPSQFEWHFNGAGQNINYTDFVTNTWTHHLVVKQGTNLTYYRDGKAVNTNGITGAPRNPQPLYLGGQGTQERWRGLADEVAILDRALSAAEVQQVFDLGKAGASLTGDSGPAPGLTISGLTKTATTLTINLKGGTGPFIVQRKSSLSETNWITVLITSDRSATVALGGPMGFFRVLSGAQTTALSYKASLSGAGEVPAVTTGASGFGNFVLDGTTLNYTISYSGLSGNPTGAHIHGPAAPSATASVLIPFTVAPGTSGVISGTATLTAQQVTYLKDGMLYANIHTQANGGGEIRGQIVP